MCQRIFFVQLGTDFNSESVTAMETLVFPVCKRLPQGNNFSPPANHCLQLQADISSEIMEPSSSSVYSAQFLAKKITVEFIIVKESQVGLQINRQSFLLRLWELVLRNHRYNRMFTSADISLSPAMKASLHFAISDQARKLHGEIDHIFVCVLKPDSLPPAFNIMTGIHVDEDKAVSWDVVENPENPVLPACKPPIPCLKKVKIEQQILGSMDEELICAICLQDFPDGTEAAATKCSHLFHCHCIVKWLSKSTSCPMCRSKLPVG